MTNDAPKRAMGGIIPKRDGSADDVPIFREPGYIISAADVRQLALAALDRLNRSKDHGVS